MPVHTERLLYVQAVSFDMEHFIYEDLFQNAGNSFDNLEHVKGFVDLKGEHE
jgi:hypothetical protein